jgi:hypothetical protein
VSAERHARVRGEIAFAMRGKIGGQGNHASWFGAALLTPESVAGYITYPHPSGPAKVAFTLDPAPTSEDVELAFEELARKGKAHRTGGGWLVDLDAPDALIHSDLPLGWAIEVYRTRLGYWKGEAWYLGYVPTCQKVVEGRFLTQDKARSTATSWAIAEENEWADYAEAVAS